MNIQCNELDNLLLESDPLALQVAQRHAQTCAACAAKLAEWNDISETARGLHTTWENEMLWPRIERSLRQEKRHVHGWVWQVAAALVVFAGLGGVLWKVNEQKHASDYILQSAALDQVESAERQHLEAINRLETLTEGKLDDPVTPLMVSYKEKLMLLDDAIAECQAGIEQNRKNAHLRKQLLAMYSEKQRTLQDVLREESNVSNR